MMHESAFSLTSLSFSIAIAVLGAVQSTILEALADATRESSTKNILIGQIWEHT